MNDGVCLRHVSWNVFDDISYCRSIATKKGTREMKKIVFYCGVNVETGDAYVRNAPEYLAMSNEERFNALSSIVTELCQEMVFVYEQLNTQETSLEGPKTAQ